MFKHRYTFFSINIPIFFVLFSTGILGCTEHLHNRASVKPNIVIILADDLGYGDLSCYGQKNYATPNIDSFYSQGVSFSDFYVPVPYCAPSRATLLTGRFPLRHGMIQNPAPDAGIDNVGIDSSEILLSELLSENGYATKCVGKWHLGHKEEYFPTKHGFDEYYGILYSNDMRPVQIIENMDTVEYPVDQNCLTKKYTSQAIDFIDRNHKSPFFLYLAHAMPHKPLAASPEFYTPETPGDLYADAIRELDWSVGQVLDALDNYSIRYNTVVIFMSDNGPWYGGSTGGLKGMKATSWEGGLRVPFIISYPKKFEGENLVDVPCWSSDIYPTLLSYAGISLPDGVKLDGENIHDVITGESTEHQPIFGLHRDVIKWIRHNEWKLFVTKPRPHRHRDDNWVDPRKPDDKTIIAPHEQPKPSQYPGILPEPVESEKLLFNIKEDPTESNNVAEQNKEIVNELMKAYTDFKKDVGL